jgi:hypothetical protein
MQLASRRGMMECKALMAEIIELREFQAARARAQRNQTDYQGLARAVAIMRENLATTAALMRSAPEDAQADLLERVEKLAALIRYGMRMMGDSARGTAAESH